MIKTKTMKQGGKTYEDYRKLKEGEPYQLINGFLVKSPSPTVNHQRLIKRISRILMELEDKGAGEVLFAPMDVYFSRTEVYQPDIIFVDKKRLSIIGEEKIEGAPDIVIEVLSPSTGYYDLRHKMIIYETFGVKEYWIIDPMEKSIDVYNNSTDGFVLLQHADGEESTGRSEQKARTVQSQLYPDFRLTAESLFYYR